MAGCNVSSPGGNESFGLIRVFLGWGGMGATLGTAGALTAAQLGGIVLGTGGYAAVVGLAVLGGYIVGVGIGQAVDWFTRLTTHNPETITINGLIVCAGKNTGYPPINDNDWTFNVGNVIATNPSNITTQEVKTRPAGSAPAFESFDRGSGAPVLHCEIGSRIGDAAAVGGAIGTVAGAVAGGMIAAAAGCFVLAVFTFGLGCLIAILIGIAVGAAVGFAAGNTVGAGVGWIMDEVRDFDKDGKAIERGCVMSLTGSWVNDRGHQHNEIHDITRATIIECGIGTAAGALKYGAVVGIGRHPQDRDP